MKKNIRFTFLLVILLGIIMARPNTAKAEGCSCTLIVKGTSCNLNTSKSFAFKKYTVGEMIDSLDIDKTQCVILNLVDIKKFIDPNLVMDLSSDSCSSASQAGEYTVGTSKIQYQLSCSTDEPAANPSADTPASSGGFMAGPEDNSADSSRLAGSLDQRCWLKEECIKYRKENFDFQDQEASEGFVKNDETIGSCGDKNAAGKEMGYCLPGGKTVTKISFGGRREFAHIGDFIKYIYQYSFIIASILAVIMVITGGIQWMSSGANPSMLESGKKKIGGAITGLVLLAISYTLLKLINPNLVNLRMPQAWLINPEGVAPPMCSSLENNVALAYKKEERPTQGELEKRLLAIKEFDVPSMQAECGNQYFVPKSNTQTCMGTSCMTLDVCVPFQISGEKKSYIPECMEGQLALHLRVNAAWQEMVTNIPGAGIVTNKLEGSWFDNLIGVIGACEGSEGLYRGTWERWGDSKEGLSSVEISGDSSNLLEYLVIVDGLISKTGSPAAYEHSHWCKGSDVLKGFWIYSEMKQDWDMFKDSRFFIGVEGNSTEAVLGPWGTVGWQNYIPVETLDQNGLYLEVTFTQTIIDKLFKEQGTWPPDTANSSETQYVGRGKHL